MIDRNENSVDVHPNLSNIFRDRTIIVLFHKPLVKFKKIKPIGLRIRKSLKPHKTHRRK